MEEHGEFVLEATPHEVWKALHDPTVLQACIDGCEEMTLTEADTFTCTVALKVGPVKARFNGTIRIVDPDPPSSYTLDVTAQGGGAGFGSGQAKVTLTEVPEGTRLNYEVNGTVGGKLAQLGARLMQSFSRKMTRTFFARFSEHWVA